MYNVEQLKIVKFLAALPKKETCKIKTLKDKLFKAAPNDRVVRNAIRKPVKEGHVVIAERGEYHITATGLKFLAKAEKDGFKPAPVRGKKTAKVVKRAKPTNGEAKPEGKKRGRPRKQPVHVEQPVQAAAEETAAESSEPVTLTFS